MSKKKKSQVAENGSNQKKDEQKKQGGFKNFMTAKNAGMLALRIVILLAIPYAYLMFCGYLFENVLHLYTKFSYMFTFISLCVLFAICVTLIVLCIVWYVKANKGNKKSK